MCGLTNFHGHFAHMNAEQDSLHLFRIAEPQAGYFTASQGEAAGFSRQRLSYHVRAGRFARIARGLYRLALYPASPFEDLHAALLRAGPRAVLSHHSALMVFGLADILPAEIHVTVPRTASRRRPGLRLHTSRLAANEITLREGLRVTSVARTIADLAAVMDEEHVLQAIHEAIARGLVRRQDLDEQARCRGGRAATLIAQSLRMEGSR